PGRAYPWPQAAAEKSGGDDVERGGEKPPAVIAALGGFDQVFGMRHHAEYIAALVDDAGDIVHGAVRVRSRRIAEDDLVLVFHGGQRVGVGKVIAVVMGDGAADDLALVVGAGEIRLGIDHFEQDFLADEPQRAIAHQGAGQEAGFHEDLETVADTENLDALLGLFADRLHDGHAGGDRAAAQVIAVGKAAGDDDQIDIRNFRCRLPDRLRPLPGNLRQGIDHVAVAVETGELDNGG